MAENPVNPAVARVFLAIPLYDIFSKEIENLLRPLCRDISGVRWVEPRQVHLTLHFFGSMPTNEIELIHLSSKKVAALFSPLKLTIAQMGGFPSLEKPNIVWLGIEESGDRLLSLQKAIAGEARTLGFRTDARPFQPHATIGRVKRKNRDLRSRLTKIPFDWSASEKTADHFALYRSDCLPEGVRYEILNTYPFAKKA